MLRRSNPAASDGRVAQLYGEWLGECETAREAAHTAGRDEAPGAPESSVVDAAAFDGLMLARGLAAADVSRFGCPLCAPTAALASLLRTHGLDGCGGARRRGRGRRGGGRH
eukprot:2798220-Prymnesium_polylepis.1